MTPTQSELLDRANDLLEQFDELEEGAGLSAWDRKILRFLEDIREELESA